MRGFSLLVSRLADPNDMGGDFDPKPIVNEVRAAVEWMRDLN